MKLKLRYGNILGFLGLSAIAILGRELPAYSLEEDSIKQPFEVRIVPPAPPEARGTCFDELPGKVIELDKKLRENERLTEEEIKKLVSLQGERVELYYYRNAKHIVDILSKLPLGEGCVTLLPLNEFQAGQGVGRGGGNIISLYGTEDYIENAQRFITSLDLPLAGIDLQLTGVQISSKDPQRLTETTAKVQNRISDTQQLLRETLATLRYVTTQTFQSEQIDSEFKNIAEYLGYGKTFDGSGSQSILEIGLAGNSIKNPVKFYQDLYNDVLAAGKIENGKFKATNKRLQPYFDALKQNEDRPPFERFFRASGLEPECEFPKNYETMKLENENNEVRCEQWKWEKNPAFDAPGIAKFNRKVLLEFAFHYADFLENPNDFDPQELQRTADALNEQLQTKTDVLQKDIDDFFVKPTLTIIQEIVRNDKKVEFAQAGRSTISTLNGVETQIGTSSTSGFQVAQSQNVEELLSRAEMLQEQISSFLPTSALGDASEAAETAATGGIPTSRLLGLAIASLEQNATPIEIETGTSLAFTPGISRNLNSAELNIDLTVVDPQVAPTAADESNVPIISRVGKQEMQTTVYTQALDFFELSTFTNQATLDGGRFRVPIIGNIWHAVFGAIPVFGDLFSFSNGNQNVLHESLILTNSFITPTPLSLGELYSPQNGNDDNEFCKRKNKLKRYFAEVRQPSNLETENIIDRCSEENS